MMKKVTTILALIAIVVMVIPASAQRPEPGKEPLELELVAATDVTSGAALSRDESTMSRELKSLAASGEAQDDERSIYIIRLDAPPVASYEGGIAGLKATSPRATGARKLDINSPASVAYTDYLAKEQAGFVDEMNQALGRRVEVSHQYRAAFNGMAVNLTLDEAVEVAGLPGAASVMPDWVEHIQTDVGPAWIGAESIWDGSATGVATQGEEVIVGVLDTGINMDHPSFADIGGDGYDHTNPRGQFYGWCDPTHPGYDPSLVCNDKLIGVWSGDEDSPEDVAGHGSHTASTAAGNVVYNATIFAPTTSATLDRISGVAPHANIIAYNIEAEPGSGGAFGSVIIAATEQAIADAVDVINYSFGGGGADPWASAEHWFNVRQAGIFVATSAGNAGSAPDTLGSPGNAPWIMTVGASSHNRMFSNALLNLTGGSTSPPADIDGEGLTSGYGPAPIVYAGAVEPGNPGCDLTFSYAFSGEIVVCDYNLGPDYGGRVNKSINLANAGAGGFVLINNPPWAAALMVDSYAVPGLGIPYDEGEALKTWLASGSGHLATIRGWLNEPARGDIMAGFSSRGPNGPLLDVIKPDVTAPGRRTVAAVATTNPGDPPEFDVYQGTSMSSPMAAGAAALMRALYPLWSPAEIQSALMATALDSGILKEDALTEADPFDMGAGRIDLSVAARAGLVLDESPENLWAANPAEDGNPSALNLASLGQGSCVGTCSWTRTVENVLSTSASWSVSAAGDTGLSLSVSPSNFSLNPGETQEIEVVADLSGVAEGEWVFGRITLTEDGAQAPEVHFPVATRYSAGALPDAVEIVTRRNAGSQLVEGLQAIEITDLAITVHGLVKGDVTEEYLVSDPTNGDPYDGGFDPLVDGTFYVTLDAPAGTKRLIAETIFSESSDLDLFVGSGSTPDAGSQLCSSTSPAAIEYCELADPDPGTYWVLVQNWSGEYGPLPPGQLSTLVTAVVPDADSGNMSVAGPSSVPANQPFDVRVFWDTPSMAAGDHWYGSFELGSDPGNPGNIGTIPVTILRVEDDVTKSVDMTDAEPGDILTFEITVQPNVTPEDLTYEITDTIPDGMTYVPGSASASSGVVNVSGDTLTWTGVMAVPELEYIMTTSADDPLCDTGFGGYVDLELFGILAQSGITGDTVAFTAFSTGDPINYYGVEYVGMGFTDDGFAIFDPANNYGGSPWVPQSIPDAELPSNLLAVFWQDFELFYDAVSNAGVSLATAGPEIMVVEYDDVQLWGGSPAIMDFEIVMNRSVDNTPGYYEIVYAYDNINYALPATIGVEDAAGANAVALVNNGDTSGIISNGFMVCFDLVGEAPPTVITYQATVDATTMDRTLTNNAVHDTDNPGSMEASTSVDVTVFPSSCSNATPSIDTIWPPNHQFVAVDVLDVTEVMIISIWQDEPVDTVGDGRFTPDGRGVGTSTAEVRAERVGTPQVPGDGRVYHIGFNATDGNGERCSAEVLVGVPHDQDSVPVDGGALYDSTIP